jgi:hypothetical protein
MKVRMTDSSPYEIAMAFSKKADWDRFYKSVSAVIYNGNPVRPN